MRLACGLVGMALAGSLVLAGCARKEQVLPPPPRPAPPTIVYPEAPPVGAHDYVRRASSRALLVVRASELATTRSANARILGIATRLRADHTGIAAQLNMAGRRLDLLPPASLLMVDQAMLDGLSRTNEFDIAYLHTMKVALENCVSANAAYADNGDSPTLRPVARFAAATCRDDLKGL